MRTSNKEKDNTIIRLKCRLQDLEEAFENAYKLSDDKEARLKQEKKMFQDVSATPGASHCGAFCVPCQKQLEGGRAGFGFQLQGAGPS